MSGELAPESGLCAGQGLDLGAARGQSLCLRLQVHQQLREELAKVKTLEAAAAVSRELKLRCQAGGGAGWGRGGRAGGGAARLRDLGCSGLLQEDISRQKEGEKPSGGLPFFHWICQPYLRPG